ncbi:hypothetical protein CHT99_04560 [Sphingobacterium cellulitidis]|nr:hypothetical protein CHT99_04560 [Sphingobacterium cellulitidis]
MKLKTWVGIETTACIGHHRTTTIGISTRAFTFLMFGCGLCIFLFTTAVFIFSMMILCFATNF